jgi:serine/threonine protein kinase
MSHDSASRRIAAYEVQRELGHGGMGTLYLAVQPVLERPAVLKVLRRDLADDPHQQERFQREAQTAARIHHPNVVAVYDCFPWRGELYLAEEYVDGADLASLLARSGPLPPRLAALLALEVARGLEEIHTQGIVHRDLKPANVLVSRSGEVKIADFGIALPEHAPALTRIGCAVGTAPYMSPEQLLGERVDERSDSFAFGLLLYELLTGGRPFAREECDSEAALVRSIQRGRYLAPRRLAPQMPRWLGRAIGRCLRPRPQRRPALRELRREFERRLQRSEAGVCRGELSAWLRQRDLLSADPNATAVKPAVSPPPRRLRWAAAAIALLIAATAGLLRVGARPAALLPPALGLARIERSEAKPELERRNGSPRDAELGGRDARERLNSDAASEPPSAARSDAPAHSHRHPAAHGSARREGRRKPLAHRETHRTRPARSS